MQAGVAALMLWLLLSGCQSTRPHNNLGYWPGKPTIASRTTKWGLSNRNNL